MIPTWGWTYWDFGDGNYMYIARRVREGLVLYRDILAPQPPLHTLAGVVAQSLGEALLGSALLGVRVYCLAVRLLASLFIMLLALRFFGCPFRAVVASAIYLALPIGFWWSLGYQSENLELVFLIAALWLIISWEPRQVFAAGIFSALACHVNMTGAPYLMVNAIFLAFRVPRLIPWYLGSAAVVYTAIAVGANIWTDGFFVSNVLLNQVGTFPRTDILSSNPSGPQTFLEYAWMKVSSQTWEVVVTEWGFLLAMFAGMALVLQRSQPVDRRAPLSERAPWLRSEFMLWSAIGMLLSICFTAKGGTVNYIFVLGEPAVALFAAEALVVLWRRCLPGSIAEWKTLSIWNTRHFLGLATALAATLLIWWPSGKNLGLTLRQVQVELPERNVLELKTFIETYAEPGDMILAPPFYAFLTDTIVAGELAENYIWNIKYLNETFDRELYGKETGEGVYKMQEVAMLLRERRPAVILLDLAQTGQVPMIAEEVRRNYQQVEPAPYVTRNTRLGLFIRADEEPRHAPLESAM